jgi:transcriptional regulator GlxA family with amidase domain
MNITIFIFEGLTTLDAIGPFEILSRIPGATTRFAGLERGVVRCEGGAVGLTADAAIADIESTDLLLVPGGVGSRRLERDARLLEWLTAIDKTTRITASVCTGALLLGAAGLLQGRRANTHWGVRERLREFGAIPVERRTVRDGKYATSAGVSAGIDLAIELVLELAGKQVAEGIVLGVEYAPEPPIDFDRVSPDTKEALARLITQRENRLLGRP